MVSWAKKNPMRRWSLPVTYSIHAHACVHKGTVSLVSCNGPINTSIQLSIYGILCLQVVIHLLFTNAQHCQHCIADCTNTFLIHRYHWFYLGLKDNAADKIRTITEEGATHVMTYYRCLNNFWYQLSKQAFAIQLRNNLRMNKYLIHMQIMKEAGKQHIQFWCGGQEWWWVPRCMPSCSGIYLASWGW